LENDFAAARRYQAAGWLREMDQVAWDTLPKEPCEEDFCLALRNGLILCNVLNKVNPGAVPKVLLPKTCAFFLLFSLLYHWSFLF